MVSYFKNLSYLKNIGVIQDFIEEQNSFSYPIIVNISKFDEIMEKAKIRAKKSPIKKVPINIIAKASYDSQKGILKINKKEVQLKKDSFRAQLVELLLKDDKSAKKEWSWDEVIEEIEDTKDTDSLKESKKKFYPACDGLSKHIAHKISVNDFLIFNKSTVFVNPKYL